MTSPKHAGTAGAVDALETSSSTEPTMPESTNPWDVIDQAARRIAPLWPLDSFVAVNPFLGLADHAFPAAARRMARVAGARLSMPRSFYADAIRDGRITDLQLADALEAAHQSAAADPQVRDLLPRDVAELKFRVLDETREEAELPRMIPSVADAAGQVTGRDWPTFVKEQLSRWAASHLDEGQAAWGSAWSHLSPWTAWRLEAEVDRTPEVMGMEGFRAFVRSLPEDPMAAAEELLRQLDVPAEGLELYLHRLLMDVSGWAGYLRYQLWQAELGGDTSTALHELVVVRLAWEAGLLRAFGKAPIAAAWADLRQEITRQPDVSAGQVGLELDLVLQEAYEQGWQEMLVERFARAAESRGPDSGPAEDGASVEVQAAFCIDVRSEPFRRALETADSGIQTMGFAGFFGFPVAWESLGSDRADARCPVLLSPAATIPEVIKGDADGLETRRVGSIRRLRRQVKSIWTSFKMGAVSCFAFVGPVGLGYARKLLTDGLGRTRPVPQPGTDGITPENRGRLVPGIAATQEGARQIGMTLDQQVATAEGALRGMSLTEDFARLVLLAGHGSTVVNNPHASGLDCGACGGHSGEANARIAALVLNDGDVRAALAHRGVFIPEETWFLAGRHDTTTDQVTLLDLDQVPASHSVDVACLESALASAGRTCRAERASSLGILPGDDVDALVDQRSRDWSQVRPEWGLAGCAAFVAAPRSRTQALDLGGRAFLHDYAWSQDDGFGVLELIMTAPMVVASWISLQYFGSTVDNEAFGCGNKTLHNIVGSIGVLEGNGGDLRTGLPWQSVHDGDRYVHEPIRLNVVIEAPQEAMSDVLRRHDDVRMLLDQGWLNLWAMDENGVIAARYSGDLGWTRIDAPPFGGAETGHAAA